MCTAIIKPAGIALPADDLFKNCFENNPDGAGFAYSDGKQMIIRKGLMTYPAFNLAVSRTLKKKGPDWLKETPMLFHFRIGTHGSSDDPKHTHPFPVSSSLKSLEALHIRCKTAAMHNGILAEYGTSYYASAKKKDTSMYSDTMDFIASYLKPLSDTIAPRRFVDTKQAHAFVAKEVSGSRFVVMEPDGAYAKFGKWVKHEGCLYSNEDFKPRYKASYRSCYGYSDWDDDEDLRYWRSNAGKPTSVANTNKGIPKTNVVDYDLISYDLVPMTQSARAHTLSRLGFYAVSENSSFMNDATELTPAKGFEYYITVEKKLYWWDNIEETMRFLTDYERIERNPEQEEVEYAIT